jgi:hypothetical protein
MPAARGEVCDPMSEEQNAQWDRELDSMTEDDWDRFYFNCTGRHLGDPIPFISAFQPFDVLTQ